MIWSVVLVLPGPVQNEPGMTIELGTIAEQQKADLFLQQAMATALPKGLNTYRHKLYGTHKLIDTMAGYSM